MDPKTLKLEVLEKLAAENDIAKLAEVKHVLDGTDAFELSDEQFSVVSERYAEYERGAAKTYTWEQVQQMLEESRARDRG